MIETSHLPNATAWLPAPIQNGGSGPLVFDFDDQVIRIVKWNPSSHGATATFSELIASRLAQLLGAPTLRGLLVAVDPLLIPSGHHVPPQPIHIGFSFLPGSNFQPGHYGNIKNRSALPAAAVLLGWLRVGDQEGHNQYLWNTSQTLPDGTQRDSNHFLLVDLAAMFAAHDWSSGNFGVADEPYALPTHLKAEITLGDIQDVLADSDVARDDIARCLSGVPTSWAIDPALVDGAADFLTDRWGHLEAALRGNW